MSEHYSLDFKEQWSETRGELLNWYSVYLCNGISAEQLAYVCGIEENDVLKLDEDLEGLLRRGTK